MTNTIEMNVSDMQAAVADSYYNDQARAVADCIFSAEYAANIYAVGNKRWELDISRGLEHDEAAIDRLIDRQEAAAKRYAEAMVLRIAIVHGWDVPEDTGGAN